MDLSYGAEYEDFRREVQSFLKENATRAPKGAGGLGAGRPDQHVKDWQALLIENGYAARTIPKKYGGFGAEPDIMHSLIIQEEFAAAAVSSGIQGQGVSMLTPTLLEVGTEEQREKWIRPTITGEIVWCQGYSEPGAGSDLASLKTSAVVEDGDFVLNGSKIWTSSAHFADMCFILVRTEPDAPKHKGISYLLMPMDAEGIEVRPLMTMTGDATFNEVFLTNVRVPTDQIVGGRGEGWRVANTTLKHERGMIGNPAGTEANLNKLIELMGRESMDGVRAMDMPIYRDRLVRLQARLAAVKFNSLRLLSSELKGDDPGVARLIVKLNASYLNHDLFSLALDVMGEMGTLWEGDKYQRRGSWQKQFLASFAGIIGGGTAQIQKNIISERGLGMPREPKPAK